MPLIDKSIVRSKNYLFLYMTLVPAMASLFLSMNHTVGDFLVLRYLNNPDVEVNYFKLSVPYFLTTCVGHPIMITGLWLYFKKADIPRLNGSSFLPRVLGISLVVWILCHFFAGVGDFWYGLIIVQKQSELIVSYLLFPGIIRGVSSGVILLSGGIIIPFVLLFVFLKGSTKKKALGPGLILISIGMAIGFRIFYDVYGWIILLFGTTGAFFLNSFGLNLTGQSILRAQSTGENGLGPNEN